jgi:hypothetical protein
VSRITGDGGADGPRAGDAIMRSRYHHCDSCSVFGQRRADGGGGGVCTRSVPGPGRPGSILFFVTSEGAEGGGLVGGCERARRRPPCDTHTGTRRARRHTRRARRHTRRAILECKACILHNMLHSMLCIKCYAACYVTCCVTSYIICYITCYVIYDM